jgi:tetratricopeptide (TPR) repeat protein
MAAERDLLSRPEALPLPESVQGIIAARLDGLSGEEKALLQDASVIGKVFWLGAVSSVGDVDRHVAEQVLHELERRQFVRRDRRSSVAGETEYAFWHLLVGDVAYGQIPRARRAEKHRLTAEWTAALTADRVEDRAEMLAHHYRAALEFARAAGQDVAALQAPARQALFTAGERAMALNAFGAAERFYADAVALTDHDDPERPHLLFRHGRALWLHTESGQDVLAEARDGLMSIGEVEPAAEAEIMIGDLLWHEARRDAAFQRFDRAQELIESVPTSASKAWVVAHVSRFKMLAGRNDEAIALGKEALEMAETLGLASLRSNCLNNIGVARVSAGDRDGVRDIETSIAIAEQVSSPWDEARGYLNLASVLGNLGDLRRCRELHERADEISRRHGLETGVRFLRGERALDLYHAGEWEEALRIAEEFIAEVEVGSAHYMESACRFVRAWIRLARGRVDEALTDGARALVVARDAKDPQALHPTLAEYARLLLMAGRPRDAETTADELLGIAGGASEQLIRSQWIVPIAFVLAELGRSEEALAETNQSPLTTPWADAARAVAAGDLPEAADVMAEIGALSAEAYARLRGAERLMTEGRERDAQAQLSRALVFYRSVGATAYVRRGEALLASTA